MKEDIDFTVFSDGGSRGNPGQAAYGYVIYSPDKKVFHEEGKVFGIATNNFAEYMGLLEGLRYLLKNTQKRPLKIACFMDSMLVAQQLSGNWKIKNEQLRSLYFTIKQVEDELGNITYMPIPREQNKEADRLVNKALDEQQ